MKPTQITLRIDTDVDCAELKYGTGIFGGAATDPITTTTACEPKGARASIGTLVLTPSAGKDDAVTIAVVAGITRSIDECVKRAFDGCIVARRRLRFAPHDPLELPVTLSRACIGVACSDDRTCVEGRCATADVDDPGLCMTGPDCGVAPPASSADGGIDDASRRPPVRPPDRDAAGGVTP